MHGAIFAISKVRVGTIIGKFCSVYVARMQITDGPMSPEVYEESSITRFG